MALTAVLAVSQPAEAVSVDYHSLTTYTNTGTPPAGPYGTVHLEQVGSDVQITVTPATGLGFVTTGAGSGLKFELNGIPTVTFTGLTSGFTFTRSDISADGTGSWDSCIKVTNHGSCTGITGNVIADGVPEPTTLVLLGAAIIGIGLIRRRWNVM